MSTKLESSSDEEAGTENWYQELTSEVQGASSREDVYRIPPPIPHKAKKGWRREHLRQIRAACANPTHQQTINPLTNAFPALGSPGIRQGPLIEVRGPNPTVIVDSSGRVAMWYIPNFLGTKTLGGFNEATNDFISYEMATEEGTKVLKPMGIATNGKARAGPDTYTTTKGIYGAGTYVKAWHQRGHWEKKDYEPSRSLTQNRSTKQLIRRDNYFHASQAVDWKIDDFLELVHPRFRRSLAELREKLKSHPTIGHLQTIFTSDFPGRSVIVNRQSGEHFDKWGIPNGMDVLLAAGSVRSGGDVVFADLELKVELLPGTALFFDGTHYRHLVTKWQGDQRISIAYFAHRSVFQQLEIDIDFELINLDDVKERVDFTPLAKSLRSKRRGNGGYGMRKRTCVDGQI
ncbi:hypothetical protein FRC07_006685 [Ceratobasidium sp. 392]|nr:hypothetical protein FRC07_006685 [Ceratobasidium sp. 392]